MLQLLQHFGESVLPAHLISDSPRAALRAVARLHGACGRARHALRHATFPKGEGLGAPAPQQLIVKLKFEFLVK